MIELNIWKQNPQQFIIGADEVGRGCFAGPIVGCAVKISSKDKKYLSEVKDSKKLSPKKEILYSMIFTKLILFMHFQYATIHKLINTAFKKQIRLFFQIQ